MVSGDATDDHPFFEAPVGRVKGGASWWRGVRAQVGSHTCVINPSVTCVIVDEAQQEVVLVRARGLNGWVTPGGIVEQGERPADTAVREAREETGLSVEPVRLVGCYSGSPFIMRYDNGDTVQGVIFAFLCRVIGGSVTTRDPGEITQVRRFSRRCLPAMQPHWRDVLDDALSGCTGCVG